jgi:methionyl-tRNA formyltransferase
MVNVVFMGTPDFAVPALQKLMVTQNVTGVVTQPDRPAGRGRQLQPPPIKVVAEAAAIPVYQPPSLRRAEAAEPIRAWQPDLIVVAAFGQILRPHLLDLPPHGCLNIHASLLPRWRGASPIQHALLAGDSETGISLMQMDVGMDTGPVYVRESLAILPDDTAASLHDRLALLAGAMIERYLPQILAGELTAVPQDNNQATYAPLIKKEDGRLDWQQPAVELERRIRALTPWPGAYTTWQGKRLKILAAQPVTNAALAEGEPGDVIGSLETAVIRTGDGGLELLELQLEGKRPATIAEFLRGYPDFVANQKLGG